MDRACSTNGSNQMSLVPLFHMQYTILLNLLKVIHFNKSFAHHITFKFLKGFQYVF
jgi:hypothetical protein